MQEGLSEQIPLEIGECIQKFLLKMYINTKLPV